MRHLRHHLSFANIVACLALFVALGGTATAAVMLTGKNIKDRSLTGKDVKDSSLTGKDVKDRSLTAADLGFTPGSGPAGAKGDTGASGARGDTGAAGPTGPRGPSDGYHTEGTAFIGATKSLTLNLPAGRFIVLARSSIYNSAASATWGSCMLTSTGSGSDQGIVDVPAASETSLSLQGALTLPTAGTATLSCTAAGPLATTMFGRTHIDAIEVAKLTGGL